MAFPKSTAPGGAIFFACSRVWDFLEVRRGHPQASWEALRAVVGAGGASGVRCHLRRSGAAPTPLHSWHASPSRCIGCRSLALLARVNMLSERAA